MVAIVVEFIVLGLILVKLKTGSKTARGPGYLGVIVALRLIGVGGLELSQRVATSSSETQHEISGGVRLTIDKDGMRMFAKKPTWAGAWVRFPSRIHNFEPSTQTFS